VITQIPNSSAYTMNSPTISNNNNKSLVGPYSMQGQSLFKNRYHVGGGYPTKLSPSPSPSTSLSSSPTLFAQSGSFQNLERMLENLNAEQLRKLVRIVLGSEF
jgi:hypothetical protein